MRYGARNSSTATSDIQVVGVMLASVNEAREWSNIGSSWCTFISWTNPNTNSGAKNI
ncbi:hypothetical protein D3C73_1641990 [compost metagenome]